VARILRIIWNSLRDIPRCDFDCKAARQDPKGKTAFLNERFIHHSRNKRQGICVEMKQMFLQIVSNWNAIRTVASVPAQACGIGSGWLPLRTPCRARNAVCREERGFRAARYAGYQR
jgi:hypothetical protein